MEAEAGFTVSVGEVSAVMDSAAAVLAVMVLVGEVLAHPAQVSAGAVLVRDSAGRVDLRVEVSLVGEIVVASVIVGFAISKGTLSILASMALDTQITISTTTSITTHTRITTTMPI